LIAIEPNMLFSARLARSLRPSFEAVKRKTIPACFDAVFDPLFDLVEIAIVRQGRIVGLFVGPVVIHARASSAAAQTNMPVSSAPRSGLAPDPASDGKWV
jgi:hypothetical protein